MESITTNKKITIVGGGPSGLFCAYLLLNKGYKVDLYDGSTGLAKKFLIAGNGGLNLTHSEDLKSFSKRYTHNEDFFYKLINEFTPTDLRAFCERLGVETFIGTSGRVFPKKLKAAEILLNWSKLLKENPNFNLYMKHKLIKMDEDKNLLFTSPDGKVEVSTETLILALGGGSWKKTGSDGSWVEFLPQTIERAKLRPMNCGFETTWSDHMINKLDRSHLKNVTVKLGDKKCRGELMLTPYGIEGGAIYAISNFIRDEIDTNGKATIMLDLKPDLSIEELEIKLESKKAKESLSNHLRKKLKLDKAAITLLYEVSKEISASVIKNLPITVYKTRPIDEAISTSGGVVFNDLTEDLESKVISGLYFAGEMLDYEAPTGGYLLQGCFSTSYRVVKGIVENEAKDQ